MSDEDAGVMSLAFEVRRDVAPVDGDAASDADAIREAVCFSAALPYDRILDSAQHIVRGRDGAPYAMALSMLGTDLSDSQRATLCE